MNIPRQLYSKEIVSYINDLFCFDDANDFDSLDELEKDQLVALGIKALGGDIDLVLSSEAIAQLTRYLLTPDRDEEIELTRAVRESAYEHFSMYFNELIDELKHDRETDALIDAGKRRHVDQINGEISWI